MVENLSRWEPWPKLQARFSSRPERRLLAIDGGGIRGIISLRILERIERLLQKHLGRGDDFVLADWFDYVAGTSVGAIIAAGIALGWRMERLVALFDDVGEQVFAKRPLWARWKSFYGGGALEQQLKKSFGAATTLAPEHFKCLLTIVTRNATTDSAWPISNNPFAKYNDPLRADSNLKFPLWQIVRASAAAPVYFPSEVIKLPKAGGGTQTFSFVDGGTTAYNNPSFLLYRMATHPAYRLGWAGGENKLLLVSVGTGARPVLRVSLARDRNLVIDAYETLLASVSQASVDQDVCCRMIGRCTHGAPIDREISHVIPDDLSEVDLSRAFLYARYDADLSAAALDALGFSDIDPAKVARLDALDQMSNLFAIGSKAAEAVRLSHFGLTAVEGSSAQ